REGPAPALGGGGYHGEGDVRWPRVPRGRSHGAGRRSGGPDGPRRRGDGGPVAGAAGRGADGDARPADAWLVRPGPLGRGGRRVAAGRRDGRSGSRAHAATQVAAPGRTPDGRELAREAEACEQVGVVGVGDAEA